MEGDPRLLHLHRVRALLGQLPGAPHGQDPEPQAPDARASRSPLQPGRRVHRAPRRQRRDQAGGSGRRGHRGGGGRGRRASRRSRGGVERAHPAPQPRARRHPPRRALGLHHAAAPARSSARCSSRTSTRSSTCGATSSWSRASSRTSWPKPFQGMETNGNPWNLSRMDRAGVGRRPRHPDDGGEARRRRSSSGWAARRATTTAPRRSRARRPGSSSRRASTSRSSGRKRAARAIRRGARATSSSSRMLAEGNAATLNGYKEQGGVRTVVTTCPHCFNTLKNEYPDFGAEARGRAPHRLPPRPRGRGQARADEARRGARRLPRLLLPRPLQRRVRPAARDPEAHPGRGARRARVLDQAARPLLRRRRRADVDGGAEHRPRERQAHAPARSTRAPRRSRARAPSA